MDVQLGTVPAAMALLFEKGVRYSTVVDVGCADGSFFLDLYAMGLLPGAVPLHVDANALYEQSLREIKDVVGGDYRIAAVADAPGETTITTGSHPYWNSRRPVGDRYWERLSHQARGQVKVPAVTLDGLVAEVAAKPPYLLKMDVQGSELDALRGGSAMLEQTHVIICEADTDDFDALHAAITGAGFDLFDLTDIRRQVDHTLGWFYPVYISRKLAHLRRRALWDREQTESVVKAQIERRRAILKRNAAILAKLRHGRT